MKLMVFRFSAMGDVAMTVPVIQALLNAYREVEIVMVSRPFFAPLFKDLPRVKFIGTDLNRDYKGLTGLYRLFRFLNREKAGAIADLHDVLRTKILDLFFQFTGYKVAVIEKGRAEKKALTRTKHKIFRPLQTTHQRYADVFERLGYPVDLKRFIPLRPAVSKSVELFISPVKDNKIIGIAPFAAHAGKQYPLEKIKDVIRLLLEKDEEVAVFLFGGGSREKALLDELEALNRNRIVNVAGVFPFEEELQLISRLRVMLSMDSANGHLAALYGVPVVTIWGVTHPYAGFVPFNQPAGNQILPDLKKFPQLPVSIYGSKTFPGFEAIWDTITPETVAEIVMNFINHKEKT